MSRKDDEEEISDEDQRIYDAYSGLDIYGTEIDADFCDFEDMDDSRE